MNGGVLSHRFHQGCCFEFLNKIKSNSSRNGTAMRSVPFGDVRDIDDLLGMAELQASITHDTEIGRKSSHAVALASHYTIYNLDVKSNLAEFVSQYTKYPWQTNWIGSVDCCWEETVNAILTVLYSVETQLEVIINGVDFCGDVDTVAVVALGIAGRSKEYDAILLAFLFEKLENDKYGKHYLIEVGRKLSACIV